MIFITSTTSKAKTFFFFKTESMTPVANSSQGQ